MINEILTASGVPYRETQFPRLLNKTCAVYLDDVDADGADDLTCIFTHNITIELYAPKPDPTAEANIEAQLNSRGIKWSKQTRYWLQSEQRYQTIYEFAYIEK